MKKLSVFSAIIFPLLLTLTACSNPAGSDDSPTWDTVDSWIRFTTNDSDYYGDAYWETDDTATALPLTVTVKKVGGYGGSAFGVVFCSQSDNSFYAAVISTYGGYRIDGRHADGEWYSIKGWTDAPALNEGIGAENILSVSYSDPNYTFNINGTNTFTFSRSDPNINSLDDLTGGVAGFIAAISSTNENFPDEAVDVRFRMTAPVSLP